MGELGEGCGRGGRDVARLPMLLVGGGVVMRMDVVNKAVVVAMAVPAGRGRSRGSRGVTVVGHGVKRPGGVVRGCSCSKQVVIDDPILCFTPAPLLALMRAGSSLTGSQPFVY